MKPLSEFQGRWNGATQTIRFTWDARALGTDGYIVIAAVVGEGSSLRLDVARYTVKEVRTLPGDGNTVTMKVPVGQAGVRKMMFCGASAPALKDVDDNAVLQICRSDPSCLTAVMMGRAEIAWSDSVSTQDTVKLVTLEVTSNCDISNGVLGYRCVYGKDLVVTLPFPGDVGKGKQKYSPILVPRDCEVTVVPYDAQFGGNLMIKKKNKLFGF